jgi:murein L,D-transpeptidase YcbB/YkuD
MQRITLPTALRGATLALAALLLVTAASADDDARAAALQRLVEAGQAPWLTHAPSPAEADTLRRLYTTRQYAPLWLHDGTPSAQAATVIAVLSEADAEGLAPLDYDAPRLAAEAPRIAGSDADAAALFDVALSVAAMRYASHAAVGRVDPRAVGFSVDVDPKRPDLAALVLELSTEPDPRARLHALDPPFPAFARLRETLVEYRALSRTDLPAVPDFPKLTPGDSNPQLPALRARLTALGDLPADATPPADPAHYDDALAAAVRAFQLRHGLADDAVVGPGTLRALKTPPAARVQQIELAMERMRWLPYSWPARFIFVNIPEFRLRGFAAGSAAPGLAMNVVVGQAATKAKHKTPVLQADMTYLVFRPYWMVPSSIAKKELWPKIDNDPSYLDRNNMLVSNGRIRQRPGRGNSLGLLKFIFPNPHHVYLHDTPSKGLFARSRRDFSHGCIRVSDPPALAEFVLTGMNGWDRAKIDKAMKSGPDDRHVTLDVPVPVYIFYTTVVVENAGQVIFFDDIYGHDATLQRQLAKGFPYSN